MRLSKPVRMIGFPWGGGGPLKALLLQSGMGWSREGAKGGRGCVCGGGGVADLVHRGADVMVSTKRVRMTGLPRMLHRVTAAFCTMAIFSEGTSSPKLPRLRRMASASMATLSKLVNA